MLALSLFFSSFLFVSVPPTLSLYLSFSPSVTVFSGCILARSSLTLAARSTVERGPLTHGPRSAPRSTAKFRKLGLARASSSEPARPIPVGSLAAAQQSSCDARPRERTLGSRSRPAVLHRLLLLLSWFSFPPPSSSFLFRCFFFPYQPWRDDTPCSFLRSFLPPLPLTHSLARSLPSSSDRKSVV